MHVLVDRGGRVQLIEPDDFRSFKLVVEHDAAALSQVRALLTGIASRIDETHAWISQDWLRRDGAIARPAAWQEKFAELLVYADGKGWLDPATGDVRAHVAWQPA